VNYQLKSLNWIVEGELDFGPVTDRISLTDLSAMVRQASGYRPHGNHLALISDANNGSEWFEYQRHGHQCDDRAK
jgi:hypothetical protein